MQVSVENTGGLERRVTVHVPEAEIQEKVDSRLKELSKQVKIKGFRPGRVPMSVIRQRYGKSVRAEIANETMQASLQQAIRDEQLRPASNPRVDHLPADISRGDLNFTAVIEVYPEIGELDAAALEVQKPHAEVQESDIDDMLETLRTQRRGWDPVDRKPEEGDHVLFEYVATTAEGRVPKDGHHRLAVVIGSSGFDQLEAALRQLRAGAAGEFQLTFPADYRDPALAGREARVELGVKSVSEARLPAVDESFIRSFGVADGSLETLRQEIRGNLERELNQAVMSLLKVQLVGLLLEKMPELPVPGSLVRQEAAALAGRAAAAAGREANAGEVEAWLPKAADRVRGGLLLGEIARRNRIRIDALRVRRAIETLAHTYEDPAEVVQLYYGNPQLMGQVENRILEEQVVDWVLENAKVTPREMQFKEVIAAAASANA